MKTLITLLFIAMAFNSKSQLKSSEKLEVSNIVNTAIAPLKVEIKWLRTGKTTDSLNLVKANAVINAQALTIDSIRKVIPPTYKYFIGDRLQLINDTLNTKQ